ncbi:MAG: flavodoxin FldA [Massilibacteroides sp.]|nr:flavodoxin FldA [Massilibacteroides sp.]MDD3062693.1 flavodoxin FldA [Massilibacteroides sp.]MDD4660186.1 flavodoxin FldA [Massilibacteroides sp.]
MKKTGIFYGSSTGTVEDLAQRIASKLGVDSSDIFNVSEIDVDTVVPYDVLLLGSSTWGAGDLQDDWEDFLKKLKKTDLSGKTVALFGAGDSASFSDTFCDAIGTIYQELQGTGCTFAGAVPTDGYTFDDSTAVVNGKFVGLALDELNEDGETEGRMNTWIEQLKQEVL